MGFKLFSDSSSCTSRFTKDTLTAPNPNPFNYYIRSIEQVKGNVVAQIVYPDCTTYEGMKIILFKNADVGKLKNLSAIDPHFLEDCEEYKVFARFEPTQEGYNAAITLAFML